MIGTFFLIFLARDLNLKIQVHLCWDLQNTLVLHIFQYSSCTPQSILDDLDQVHPDRVGVKAATMY